ncbi:MAG: hypothetical protein ACOYOU_10090 [Kiritimatiellia bacterium]
MTSPQPALLISDACVLIDYCKADCHDVLALASRRFLPIRVPRIVIEEVRQLSEDDARNLGIGVLEVTMQQLQEAAVRGGPSRQDKLCFVTARDHGGAVWSNDKRLRKICHDGGVRRTAALDLEQLVAAGVLARVGTTGRGVYYRLGKRAINGQNGQKADSGAKGAKLCESRQEHGRPSQ